MSLLDDLKAEAHKRNPLAGKQAQIEALRAQAQAAFKEQFLLAAANAERIAFLQGRIAAFDECLQLFVNEAEQAKPQQQRQWDADER